jgi:hypothetical protein
MCSADAPELKSNNLSFQSRPIIHNDYLSIGFSTTMTRPTGVENLVAAGQQISATGNSALPNRAHYSFDTFVIQQQEA